jgi:drug/metabolite transporter (DMT)-like permease
VSRALAAGLVTVVAWGSAFVAIRGAADVLSPGSIALGRLLVSTAALSLAALWRRESVPPLRELVPVAVYGVLWLGVYSVSLNAAERRLDAGTAAMLINTGPLLIALLAGGFLGEGFPRGLFVGCAVAFAGCVLIGLGQTGAETLGVALCMVAALAYASGVIVQKIALRRLTSFQVTWLGSVAAMLACLPFAATLAGEVGDAGGTAIGWVVYLGLIPTALGFATWTYALRRGSAGRTASLNYLIPVVAIVLGWLVLSERPAGLAFAGGALCVAGVYLARRQRPRR